MTNRYEIIKRLIELDIPEYEQRLAMRDFAYYFGWTPSDSIETAESNYAKTHLVVEHGLENTAVISFLKRPFAELTFEERTRLLNISYNNLVDWHIQIEREQVTFVFNRYFPERIVEKQIVSHDKLDILRSESFERISGKRQSTNIPALDEALIKTIQYWKGSLATELDDLNSNIALSALFNAIIFTRAVEDHYRTVHYKETKQWLDTRALIEECATPQLQSITLRQAVLRTLERFGQRDIPTSLINQEYLAKFDNLSAETVRALVESFYRIKYARPYEYNFSVMSKNALSKIYERYVSLLRVKEATHGQQAFYFASPDDVSDRTFGGIYTPQYIARFFVRYLREQIPSVKFKRLRSLEPAVGSGIFLRNLLEMQCDPLHEGVTTELIQEAFQNVTGLDLDPNATQAATLSLSLLHLVLTGKLPDELHIIPTEAIDYFMGHTELRNSLDVVIANPPFIPIEDQPEELRDRIRDFMANHASGRIDTSLAFLKLAVDALKPGGFGLYILPYAFLLGDHAAKMREYVSQNCWIKCLVDLSAIQVFEKTGAYVILFIFQKKGNGSNEAPALIVKCRGLVGRALLAAVEDREEENPVYQLYHTSQETFQQPSWILTPPSLESVKRKLAKLPSISEFMHVRQGFVTGADKVFIVSESVKAELDPELFVPYLSDRDMQSYTVPDFASGFVFYPYIKSKKITEEQLRGYKKTWDYLNTHYDILSKRPSVIKGRFPWWQPHSPCSPNNLMRPKIITPHIVLVPRFALDIEGKYAVSHSPLLYPKDERLDKDVLRFFLAVLNSTVCFRTITDQAHKYSRGYSVLEVTTLKKTPVPDLAIISTSVMQRVLELVDHRLIAKGSEIVAIEREIDNIVLELYGLDEVEGRALGLEMDNA